MCSYSTDPNIFHAIPLMYRIVKNVMFRNFKAKLQIVLSHKL